MHPSRLAARPLARRLDPHELAFLLQLYVKLVRIERRMHRCARRHRELI